MSPAPATAVTPAGVARSIAPSVVAPSVDGRPARRDRGGFLAGQLLILLFALLWLPLGTRDAAGVSSILPALRPAAPDVAVTIRSESLVGEPPLAMPKKTTRTRPVVVALALAAVVPLVLGAGRHDRRRPGRHDPRDHLLRGPPGSRAPPLAH